MSDSNSNIKTNCQKVKDFNKCFNHFISDSPYTNIFDKEPKLVKLKYNLINEEIFELKDAFEAHDIIEIIDALADILYVVYGFCITFGINIDISFKEYMCNKLSDLKHYTYYNTYKEFTIENNNYEIVKDFFLIKSLINNNNYNSHENYKNYITSIKSADFYNNLKYNIEYLLSFNTSLNTHILLKNYDKCIDIIHDILYHTYNISILLKLNIDDAFNIVHNSNMSKICISEGEAIETVEFYKSTDNRYENPAYAKNDFGYIIYNNISDDIKNCKTLKNKNYIKTDFTSLF